MSISSIIQEFNTELEEYQCTLVAVSKTKPAEVIMEAYDAGHRDFGENKVQELVKKHETLPDDIRWHMIGHLQSNKVKYIAPFVHLIHAVDSEKLLRAINKEARKNDRVIDCLLQVYIASEESKFGFSFDELYQLLDNNILADLPNIRIVGLMGMATNTFDENQVSREFESLRNGFQSIQQKYSFDNLKLQELSIGMSGDYKIALKKGSTMVRIGSTIFGPRNYP